MYPAALTGRETIIGQTVRCISPEWTIKFHSGYELETKDYHMDWSWVVVNFWNKPINGSPPKELTTFTSDQKGAPYGVLPYAWSPDGRDLAYARYENKSDMVLISNVK